MENAGDGRDGSNLRLIADTAAMAQIGLAEREGTADEIADAIAQPESEVFFLNTSGGIDPANDVVSDVDTRADEQRTFILERWSTIVDGLVSGGIVDAGSRSDMIKQARTSRKMIRQQASGGLLPVGAEPAPASAQLDIFDLYATMDFSPIPGNIPLELFEINMFEENHISGSCLSRIGVSVTKRGADIIGFDAQKAIPVGADAGTIAEYENVQAERDDQALRLEQWFERINTVHGLDHLLRFGAIAYTACGNAYYEVIRDKMGPQGKPATLDNFITSTVRVLKYHRGYVQWLAGRFVWYNPYMPKIEDRIAGAALWQQWWEDRGVDTNDSEFIKSAWCRTISSNMPVGTWNPHLTEVIHLKDVWLRSKYYGFPKDYRVAKLHMLFQYTLNYNIALQRNSQIPPFVIIFHGTLSQDGRNEIKDFLKTVHGPDNWNNVPIIVTPIVPGSPITGPQKAGMEIIKLAGEHKEAIFMQLWSRVERDLAMHYGFPLDLLTTENSNRATISVAQELFNDWTVNDLHRMFEAMFRQLTFHDLGFERVYYRFNKLDIADRLSLAQEADIYYRVGVLNPNEIRDEYKGLPAREGGDMYATGIDAFVPVTARLRDLPPQDMSPEIAAAQADQVTAQVRGVNAATARQGGQQPAPPSEPQGSPAPRNQESAKP